MQKVVRHTFYFILSINVLLQTNSSKVDSYSSSMAHWEKNNTTKKKKHSFESTITRIILHSNCPIKCSKVDNVQPLWKIYSLFFWIILSKKTGCFSSFIFFGSNVFNGFWRFCISECHASKKCDRKKHTHRNNIQKWFVRNLFCR